jgi:hypothetical protein
MTNVRLSLPSVFVLVAIASAAAFAAGRSMSPATGDATTSSSPSPRAEPPAAAMPLADNNEPLPPGHPKTGAADPMNAQPLPAGHPPVDPMDPAAAQLAPSNAAPSSLEYKAPARWVLVPNASTMRLATYRVPRAPGDTEDAELSITQAGGSIEANADRWVGQFDAAGQKTAKRGTRNVGTLAITTVEVQGKFEGGMGRDAGTGFALLGAIVATPGMPHFFKMTGPAKTVLAARAEFDAMMGTLVQH